MQINNRFVGGYVIYTNIFKQKKKEEEIPLLAGILAIADAYEAMTG